MPWTVWENVQDILSLLIFSVGDYCTGEYSLFIWYIVIYLPKLLDTLSVIGPGVIGCYGSFNFRHPRQGDPTKRESLSSLCPWSVSPWFVSHDPQPSWSFFLLPWKLGWWFPFSLTRDAQEVISKAPCLNFKLHIVYILERLKPKSHFLDVIVRFWRCSISYDFSLTNMFTYMLTEIDQCRKMSSRAF